MVIRSFDSVLDECLAAISLGESVEDCLARYPQHADRLRPLLILAAKVQKTPIAVPRPWPQATAWQRVRQRAADLRSPQKGARLNINFGYGPWLRPIAATLAVLLALFFAAGGTALASQNSLPDSPLYRVKLATEEVRLLLVFDDVHRAEILMEQSEERMDEILTMTRQDKDVPGNALSALRSRNERAADILADHPDQADLLSTLVQQSESQESNLIMLFPEISDDSYTEYTEAVATVHNTRLPGTEGLVGIQPEELAEGIQHISGLAQPVEEGIWTVGGLEVRVDSTTIGELQPGATARFVVGKNSRGEYRALTLSTIQADLPPSGSVVSGEVEQVTDQGIVIAGQLIPITEETFRTGKLKTGQKVEVKLGKSQTGAGVVASTVRPVATPSPLPDWSPPFTFEGDIEGDVRRSGDEWTIGGLKFLITSNTTVDAQAGEAKNGARALVEATIREGELLAHSVTVLAADSDADSANLIGTFQESRDGVWYVSGVELVPPVRMEEPQPNSLLALDLRSSGNDLEVLETTLIEAPGDPGLVRLNVIINQIDGAIWTLDFGTVRVASTADFSGPEPVAGARAIVWGRQNQNGVFEASYARVLDKSPVIATPTPAAPSPSPTP